MGWGCEEEGEGGVHADCCVFILQYLRPQSEFISERPLFIQILHLFRNEPLFFSLQPISVRSSSHGLGILPTLLYGSSYLPYLLTPPTYYRPRRLNS